MNALARNAIAVARADDLLRELNILNPDEIDIDVKFQEVVHVGRS